MKRNNKTVPHIYKKRRAERQDKMRELMVFAVSILVVCILLAGQEFRKVRDWNINEDEESSI
jgi:hypothetical protein